jgi:hypothetical protein
MESAGGSCPYQGKSLTHRAPENRYQMSPQIQGKIQLDQRLSRNQLRENVLIEVGAPFLRVEADKTP